MFTTVDTPPTRDDRLSPDYRPTAAPAAGPPPTANETEFFQHYQVLRREDGSLWELGRGAMGVTYKAFDTNLRCHVALKVISAQHLHSEVAGQRFVREARVAARLRHRNIATVYHLGVDPQSFFYSMEFVDGETLEDLVGRVGPLPLETVLCVGLQTARALAAAARQGLIHRDLKPANLMVLHEDEEGEEQLLVKVIDFGLARSYDPHDSNSQLTATGFVGTPLYASPEQLEEHDLDIRSDIYSLGVTLWILLTGNPPFDGKMTQVITQHLTAEPPWRQLGACPEPARALLERMLKKDPRDRFQTANELRRAVEDCLQRTANGEEQTGRPADGPASQATLKTARRRPEPPTRPAGEGPSARREIGRRSGGRWKPAVAGAAVVLVCAVGLLFRRSASVASDTPRPAGRVTPTPASPPGSTAARPAPDAPHGLDNDASTLPGCPPTPTDLGVATPCPPTDETPATPAGDCPSPDDPQLRPASASPDVGPAPTASTPDVSPPPGAAKDDHDEKTSDDNADAAARDSSKTTQRSHAHRSTHSTPTPPPSFLQRIFGLKPKSTPRNR